MSKQVYNNPFLWCFTPYKSMENVLLRYPDINWYNIKITRNNITPGTFSLIIDNDIIVHYVHIKMDAKCSTPTQSHGDVLYKYAYKYVVDKYFKRVARMLDNDAPVHFIIQDETYGNSTYDIVSLYQRTGHMQNALFISNKLAEYDAPNIMHTLTRTPPGKLVPEQYDFLMDFIK